MEKFIKIPIPEGFDFKTEIVDGYITHKWVKIDNKKHLMKWLTNLFAILLNQGRLIA